MYLNMYVDELLKENCMTAKRGQSLTLTRDVKYGKFTHPRIILSLRKYTPLHYFLTGNLLILYRGVTKEELDTHQERPISNIEEGIH